MNDLKPYQYLFSCLIILTLSLVQISHAQNSPQDFVDAHNAARAVVGVGPIEWDDTVAAYALEYTSSKINDCMLEHSSGPYGENLAQGGGAFTGTDAVQMWVDEQVYYDYTSNTWGDSEVCGHYTQVIWANSIRLGCSRLQCDNGWWYISSNYDPPAITSANGLTRVLIKFLWTPNETGDPHSGVGVWNTCVKFVLLMVFDGLITIVVDFGK